MEDGDAGMACAPWLPHPARQPDGRTGIDRDDAAERYRALNQALRAAAIAVAILCHGRIADWV